MAVFEQAFEKTMENEGGFVLHEVSGDSGGLTYAGIAENFHPEWPGWPLLKGGNTEDPKLTGMVRSFYKEKFWDRFGGDQVPEQEIAESIFDFGVNAGLATSVKLAQRVIGVLPDGVIGPKSRKAMNDIDGETFKEKFAIAKIARYATIVNRNRTQGKFLLGWINRTLKSLN